MFVSIKFLSIPTASYVVIGFQSKFSAELANADISFDSFVHSEQKKHFDLLRPYLPSYLNKLKLGDTWELCSSLKYIPIP